MNTYAGFFILELCPIYQKYTSCYLKKILLNKKTISLVDYLESNVSLVIIKK